eukprot:1938176-Alexandrium_andersonii.AAC.1
MPWRVGGWVHRRAGARARRCVGGGGQWASCRSGVLISDSSGTVISSVGELPCGGEFRCAASKPRKGSLPDELLGSCPTQT